MSRAPVGAVLAAALVVAVDALDAGASRSAKLPPETLRGPAYELEQYASPSLATPSQRAAAERFWADLRQAAVRWRDPRAAARAGFDVQPARRPPTRVGYLHAEHRRASHDDRYLDPQRPETLVYANVPGRKLVLIGVMFSMPRGQRGPTPGGPITRWHYHRVCMSGDRRGLTPRRDGSCTPGSKRRPGSEMMHVWFTRDVRSRFAIHAPEPELCSAGLLPTSTCALVCDLSK